MVSRVSNPYSHVTAMLNGKMMHVYTDYVTYDAVLICIFDKEYVLNSPKISNYISSQRFSKHCSKISIILS